MGKGYRVAGVGSAVDVVISLLLLPIWLFSSRSRWAGRFLKMHLPRTVAWGVACVRG